MVTKLEIILCLALVLPLASSLFGASVIIQLLPDIIRDMPVVVRAEATVSGHHFTVSWKTSDPLLDEFLHATLEVRDQDHQIVECEIQKHRIPDGVEFWFDVAPAFLEASKFTIEENAHSERQPMPAFQRYWFYLRDFAANRTPATVPRSSSGVPPDTMKKLPGRIRKLRRGEKADQIWLHLGLAAYRHSLGGVSSPAKERFWLTSNQELELVFEEVAEPGTPGHGAGDEGKLIRATLFKNGREIATSSK
jgi:hypothetical protein